MINLTNTTSSFASVDELWKQVLLTNLRVCYYWIAFWYQLLILLIFFANRALLITPFNIYLLAILGSYTLGAGLRFTSEMASIVSSIYAAPAVPWCPVRILSEWVVSPAASLGHVLMAVNRIWAVTGPHFYRTHHTKAVAISASVLINIIAYATRLPHFAVACRGAGNPTICAVNTEVFPELYYTVKYISTAASVLIFGAFPYVVLMRRFQRNRIGTTVARTRTPEWQFSVFAGMTAVPIIFWVPIMVTSIFFPTWRLLNDSLRLWSLLTYVADPTVFILLAPDARAAFLVTVKGIMPEKRLPKVYKHRVHSIKLLTVNRNQLPTVNF